MCGGVDIKNYEPYILIALNMLLDLVFKQDKKYSDFTEKDKQNFIIVETHKHQLSKENRKLWAEAKKRIV